MDLKVNTALVIVKSVPLTLRIARQLDILRNWDGQRVYPNIEWVGRLDGRTLFGADHDYPFLLVLHNGEHKLVSMHYQAHRMEEWGMNKLPKLVLS